MSELLRIGLIGTGYIAQHHLKVLCDFSDVEVLALCNRSEKKLRETQQSFGIEHGYLSYKEMLSSHTFDALYICVSADTIKQVTLDCLEHGVPLFVEKPLGLNVNEAQEICQAAREKGIQLMVGFNRRFMSTVLKVKQLVREHGPLRYIHADLPERISQVIASGSYSDEIIDHWMYANTSHCIDLLRFFAGDASEVSSEICDAKKLYSSSLTFSHGAQGRFFSQWDGAGSWSISLYCDKVKIILCPLEKVTLERLGEETIVFDLDKIDLDYKPGFYLQARTFVDAYLKGGSVSLSLNSCDDALETMKLVEQLSS